MLHIKFDQSLPSGLADIYIKKRTHGLMHGGKKEVLLHCKLSLSAFGSGELKKRTNGLVAHLSLFILSTR